MIPDTNAIETLNARFRKAVRHRGHFPTEQAALKCVFMAIMSLDPTGVGRATLVELLVSRIERLYTHLPRTYTSFNEVTE